MRHAYTLYTPFLFFRLKNNSIGALHNIEIFQTSSCALNIVGKLSMMKGASSWFCNVSTYGGEVIEY